MSRLLPISTTALVALVLAGCGPQQGTGPAFKSFANDPRGQCFAERQELERQGDRFDTSFGEPAPGAGATDTATGILGRYLSVLLSGERSLTEVMGLIGDDLDRENQWIGWTVEAFDDLTACRRANALAVNGDLRAGRIDRATAQTRIEAIRAAYREDTARYRQYAETVALNTTRFADLYRDFAVDNNRPTTTVDKALETPARTRPPTGTKPRDTAPRTARPTATAPGRLRVEAPLPASREAIARIETGVLTNVRKRDELIERIEAAEQGLGDLDLATAPGRTAPSAA